MNPDKIVYCLKIYCYTGSAISFLNRYRMSPCRKDVFIFSLNFLETLRATKKAKY